MFHRASFRLAALYLAIIMVISLFFSITVYQLSVQELGRGLHQPDAGNIIDQLPDDSFPSFLRSQWEHQRQAEYNTAKSHVLRRLILINLFIIVGGWFLSYFLARRTLEPIEEAHKAQSRFTADASHELRTPIAAMQSEIEVALMNPGLTLKEAKEQLQSNLEELAKLTALSEGLLRLARQENGDLQKTTVEVDHLIQAAVTRVLPLAEKKGILIHTPAKAKGAVEGDETSLVEALVILVDNAIKYSPEKTEVTIAARQEHDNAVISVQDQGIGIKAVELPHIFDRFYRADTARSKQKTNGYGLGLAIAKNIIDMHKGTITAKSKPDNGSRFTIALPLVAENALPSARF